MSERERGKDPDFGSGIWTTKCKTACSKRVLFKAYPLSLGSAYHGTSHYVRLEHHSVCVFLLFMYVRERNSV